MIDLLSYGMVWLVSLRGANFLLGLITALLMTWPRKVL